MHPSPLPPAAVPVLFACENVTVTGTELTVGPNLYVIRHLVSIRLGNPSYHYDVAAHPLPFAGFVVGVFLVSAGGMEFLGGHGSAGNFAIAVLGCLLAGVCAFVGGHGFRVYPIFIGTSAGTEERILFRDQATAEGAVEAVRRAMRGRASLVGPEKG